MIDQKSPRQPIPRIESIRIKNYRALRDLKKKPLSPLTVLLGASGSGKSAGLSPPEPPVPYGICLPKPKMGVMMMFARRHIPPAKRPVTIGDSSSRCPK